MKLIFGYNRKLKLYIEQTINTKFITKILLFEKFKDHPNYIICSRYFYFRKKNFFCKYFINTYEKIKKEKMK